MQTQSMYLNRGEDMKKKVNIEIDCGEKICITDKGKPCRFFKNIRYLSGDSCLVSDGRGYCRLFGCLDEKQWSVLRHPDCIKSAR